MSKYYARRPRHTWSAQVRPRHLTAFTFVPIRPTEYIRKISFDLACFGAQLYRLDRFIPAYIDFALYAVEFDRLPGYATWISSSGEDYRTKITNAFGSTQSSPVMREGTPLLTTQRGQFNDAVDNKIGASADTDGGMWTMSWSTALFNYIANRRYDVDADVAKAVPSGGVETNEMSLIVDRPLIADVWYQGQKLEDVMDSSLTVIADGQGSVDWVQFLNKFRKYKNTVGEDLAEDYYVSPMEIPDGITTLYRRTAKLNPTMPMPPGGGSSYTFAGNESDGSTATKYKAADSMILKDSIRFKNFDTPTHMAIIPVMHFVLIDNRNNGHDIDLLHSPRSWLPTKTATVADRFKLWGGAVGGDNSHASPDESLDSVLTGDENWGTQGIKRPLIDLKPLFMEGATHRTSPTIFTDNSFADTTYDRQLNVEGMISLEIGTDMTV